MIHLATHGLLSGDALCIATLGLLCAQQPAVELRPTTISLEAYVLTGTVLATEPKNGVTLTTGVTTSSQLKIDDTTEAEMVVAPASSVEMDAAPTTTILICLEEV